MFSKYIAIGCFLLSAFPAALFSAHMGTYDPTTGRCGGLPEETCSAFSVEFTPENNSYSIVACTAPEDRSTSTFALAKMELTLDYQERAAIPPQNGEAISCRRDTFTEKPMWIASATQSPDGASLVISDPLRSGLVVYDTSGHSKSVVSSVKGSPEFLLKPSYISCAGKEYLVDGGDGRFIYLDSNLRVTRSMVLGESGPEGTVSVVYSFAPMSSSVLAIGDIKKSDGNWVTALIRIDPQEPKKFAILHEIGGLNDPARTFYHIGLTYLANLNGIGYILLMQKSPALYRVGDGLVPLGSPALSRMLRRPDLPKPSGAGSYVELYAKIEKSEMPAGLFGWHNFLYVLLRKPGSEAGETIWTLVKIHPGTGEIVGFPILLPTRSSHLLVVPGPRRWMLIEKGSYEGLGRQALGSLISLPAAWVENGKLPEGYECINSR